jgi:hypothetical protein
MIAVPINDALAKIPSASTSAERLSPGLQRARKIIVATCARIYLRVDRSRLLTAMRVSEDATAGDCFSRTPPVTGSKQVALPLVGSGPAALGRGRQLTCLLCETALQRGH